jgi:hypothetical protein
MAIASIVATVAMTAVAFAIPQQALAGGHNHNHGNSIKVDQQIDQVNVLAIVHSAKMTPTIQPTFTTDLI